MGMKPRTKNKPPVRLTQAVKVQAATEYANAKKLDKSRIAQKYGVTTHSLATWVKQGVQDTGQIEEQPAKRRNRRIRKDLLMTVLLCVQEGQLPADSAADIITLLEE